LVTKLTVREEADRKEREREQRKALLKEKRNTSQLLVQARHAANEAQSKVKRGAHEITKVQDELDKLTRWRQGQEDRLQLLMQQLVEEQRQVEEEFLRKHSEADDIKTTLSREQDHLESEFRSKEDEVSRVEAHLQYVDTTLQQLDDGLGVTWHGSWKEDKGLDDSNSSIGGSRMGSILGPEMLGITNSADLDYPQKAGWQTALWRASLGSDATGEEAKVALRSEGNPIPAPITATRSGRAPDNAPSVPGEQSNVAPQKQREQSPQAPQRAGVQRQTAGAAGSSAPAGTRPASAARGAGTGNSYPGPQRQPPQADGGRIQPTPVMQVPGVEARMRNANIAQPTAAPGAANGLMSWDM